MASFELPKIQDNPDGGWGPSASSIPADFKFKDIPYAPFAKSDKISRFADWNGVAGDDKQGGQGAAYGGRAGAGNRRRDGAPAFGSGLANAFADLRIDDEASFSVVDNRTTAPRRGGPGFNRGRGGRGTSFASNRGNQRGGGRGGGNFGPGRGGQRGGGGGWGYGGRRGYRDWDKNGRAREASVTVLPDWVMLEEIEFHRLSKLRLDVEEPENLESYGMLYPYDKTYDRLTTRTAKPLEILDRVKYNPTTSEDPVILKLAKENTATIYVTDSILSFLMCAPRSVYPWDVVIVRKGDKLFFDKRDDGPLDTVTVNENASEPPQDPATNNPNNPNDKNALPEVSPINTAPSLAEEAAHINTSFGFQAVTEKAPPPAVNFENPNPFLWPEETRPLASCGYRYRLYDLSVYEGETIKICVRTEVDAYMPGSAGSPQNGDGLVKIRALNEFDPKAYGSGKAPDWRTKLDTQRGAVVAAEMKNNSCKLARWAVQSILAGAEVLKIGYVSRAHPKDERRHVILQTTSMRPLDFATQLNMSLPNGWGIIRTITDLCMKQPEGKYVLVKDPNRPVIRLYSVPMTAFTNEDEEEAEPSDAEGDDSAN
ncbi:translation initiation factor eIF-3, subunit D [Schizopora paradoxa]|uniref:Eukaryotic translation initiation factor 3 subunit D n=1 Tax=Schizopora paradoxa TaxID=27342 RepID=A0A0H2RLA9_9AGAM|nr:translation initiation factor eIF-3, subunit D [Schizopora paradoxa]